MIYKDFNGIKLSALGLGNMRLPRINPDNPDQGIDWPQAHRMMARAMEAGINYYDTAYVYGNGDSELCLGEGMKKFPRSSFHLATKFNIRATTDYEMVFETQLKRLQTDYIDFYLIHCLQVDNAQGYMNGGAIEYFEKQRSLGRIRYLGFSTHAPVDLMEKFADFHRWDFAQIQLNFFDWNYGKAKKEYEILTSRNIPVMVMEPVRGGRLATLNEEANAVLRAMRPDWSIPSWALRFVRTLDGVCVTLSGMSNMEQLEDNIATFEDSHTLSEAEYSTLMKASDIFQRDVFVPCTGCRYCTSTCPAQINIPAWLALYNDYKVRGNWAIKDAAKVDSLGKPADCINCQACISQCPQDIRIPDFMRELSGLLA